jgi:hypothetical protein
MITGFYVSPAIYVSRAIRETLLRTSVDGYGRRSIAIQMNPIYKQLIRSSVLGTLVLVAMVFIPAGTLNYWQGWAYLCTAIFASGLYTIYLVKYDPALLQRRQQAGPSHEKEPA